MIGQAVGSAAGRSALCCELCIVEPWRRRLRLGVIAATTGARGQRRRPTLVRSARAHLGHRVVAVLETMLVGDRGKDYGKSLVSPSPCWHENGRQTSAAELNTQHHRLRKMERDVFAEAEVPTGPHTRPSHSLSVRASAAGGPARPSLQVAAASRVKREHRQARTLSDLDIHLSSYPAALAAAGKHACYAAAAAAAARKHGAAGAAARAARAAAAPRSPSRMPRLRGASASRAAAAASARASASGAAPAAALQGCAAPGGALSRGGGGRGAPSAGGRRGVVEGREARLGRPRGPRGPRSGCSGSS